MRADLPWQQQATKQDVQLHLIRRNTANDVRNMLMANATVTGKWTLKHACFQQCSERHLAATSGFELSAQASGAWTSQSSAAGARTTSIACASTAMLVRCMLDNVHCNACSLVMLMAGEMENEPRV